MKINRTALLIIILAILGGTSYFLIRNNNNQTSSIDIRDRQFAVTEKEDIGKIFIAQRNGKQFTLEKINGSWMVNGEYKAHPNIISNILDVVTGIQIKYIPPISAYENMVDAVGRLGIKVEIYDHKNDLMKSYQVGGTTAGELGTVFIMDGYVQPYVMELPYFEGSLRGRFLYDHVDQLRDRTVFSYDDKDIEQISIHYPKDQKSSFKMVKNPNGKFEIRPYYNNALLNQRSLRQGAIERFIRSFQDLDAEAFENQHELRDSITSLIPIAEIEVISTDNQAKKVRLFSLIDVFNPEINTRAVNEDPRVERYFADCSWGDFMLVQHLLFRKILWKYEEFFEL